MIYNPIQLLANRCKSKWRLGIAKRRIEARGGPYRVHIGCGQVHFQGWVHLDADRRLPHADAVWHSGDGLPFADESCQFIYNEHFLEHLTPQEGLFFLCECHRVLVRGGVVRIAMPDMHECVRQYWEKDWKEQPWLRKYGYDHIQTGCEMVNTVFREWEHKWIYDCEELHRRLRDAGFSSIEDCKIYESRFDDLKQRETRIESLLICEATRQL